MNSPQETNASETGRMEFPALLIMSIAGEIKTVEIIHFESTSDWWKGHAKDSSDFSVQVIPISTILRAQAMERALEDCQTPEDDSAFMDDNKGERARAHLHNINRIARHALKGTVTA